MSRIKSDVARRFRAGVCKVALAAVVVQAATSMAQAQFVAQDLGRKAMTPAQLQTALETPYGRGMVTWMGEAIAVGADANCVKEKGLTPGDFRRTAHDILATFGGRQMDRQTELPTLATVFLDILAQAGDKAGATALRRHLEHPDMKAFIDARSTVDQQVIIDTLSIFFRRHAVLQRLPVRSFGYVGTGDPRLEHFSEAAKADLEPLLLKAFPVVEEIDRIMLPHHEALQRRLREDRERICFDHTMFKGVDEPLLAVCVKRR